MAGCGAPSTVLRDTSPGNGQMWIEAACSDERPNSTVRTVSGYWVDSVSLYLPARYNRSTIER